MQRRSVPAHRQPRKLVTALAAPLLLATAPACFIHVSPLDDDGGSSGTTGDDPACIYSGECNGVYIYCQNNNVGAVDESGGGGPAPNYWWVPLEGTVPNPVALCVDDAGAENDVCCIQGCGVAEGCCYMKQFDEPGNGVGGQLGNTVRVCLGDGTPIAGIDPLVDWASGSYPGYDDDIRARCSWRCGSSLDRSPNGQNAPLLCDDDQWSGLQTGPSWDPDQGKNCMVGEELNKDDPDGSEIPWELVGGPTYPVPLDCDLTDDCADLFYPTVAPFVLAPGSATFIEPETRTAHYLAVEGTTGSNVAIDVDMPGTAAGIDDSGPLFGLAEYTAIDCGDDVCPFFLANVVAYNTTNSWELQLQPDTGGKVKKHVSNVQIDLMQSTLGVLHMGLDKVAFAPGALRLRVQVDIAANGGSTYGDGTHAAFIENVDYVFADFDDGALTLTHSFPIENGTGTLTLDVDPDEYPPLAEHDLNSTESCDASTGLSLDGSHILSSDPDDDIVVDLWWIDGLPCGEDCVVPFGSHQVSLEARDARGAVDRTAEQWVYVTTPCH